jgi:hypothetical protein
MTSDNPENIESRLCAYIDGLLDEAQREEIEQYLDRYPEHRQLIDELVQQRAALRDLARENAPPDVLTHFQGQLERSALLSDLSGPLTGGKRSRRRLNLPAVAAIVLLAAGLGVIVWIALPPRRPAHLRIDENFAANIVPRTMPATSSVKPAAIAEAPFDATAKRALVVAPVFASYATVIDTPDPSRTIVMVVSGDLPKARQRVGQFLTERSISRPLPEGSTQPASRQIAQAPPTRALVVDNMTRRQAEELAQWFSAPPTTAPNTMREPMAMQEAAISAVPATLPATTQSASIAATEPVKPSEVIILFQRPGFAPATSPTTREMGEKIGF